MCYNVYYTAVNRRYRYRCTCCESCLASALSLLASYSYSYKFEVSCTLFLRRVICNTSYRNTNIQARRKRVPPRRVVSIRGLRLWGLGGCKGCMGRSIPIPPASCICSPRTQQISLPLPHIICTLYRYIHLYILYLPCPHNIRFVRIYI